VQSSSGVEQLYRGPVDLIVKTLRKDGIRGLYRGYGATVLTRLIGSPFYFVSYDLTKRSLQPKDGSVRKARNVSSQW
jgi:solute carrier family 25 carnitine/acylcarnitine transporter 20/29